MGVALGFGIVEVIVEFWVVIVIGRAERVGVEVRMVVVGMVGGHEPRALVGFQAVDMRDNGTL